VKHAKIIEGPRGKRAAPVKIVTVVGARPQFIKAAPVGRAIRDAARNGARVSEILVHTGQHYDDNMSAVFFDDLGIPAPDYELGIGSSAHGAQTGAMLAAVERILERERPDWVLVYGDTNSTLAGALAAAKMGIPVAHVEAGLRSFDRTMPEEINRVVADHLAARLFCPSSVAAANLAREGIRTGVRIVGDVMAEALAGAARRAETKEAEDGGRFGLGRLGLEKGGYILATVHRAENTDDPVRLRGILAALESVARDRPVVFPVHPRTPKAMETAGWSPDPNTAGAGLRLIEPVGYLEMVRLESGAAMILTDSGGIQKEAYWLKVPCVTLRDRTEWVETVESGWNILAGAEERRIIRAVRNFRRPATSKTLYRRGLQASRRIVENLLK
jgi:UDP-GlcNAc3NAcA epimerase